MLGTFNFSKLKHITVFFMSGLTKEIDVDERTSVMVEKEGLLIATTKTVSELEEAKERASEKAKNELTGKQLEKTLKQIEEDRNKYPKGMITVNFIPFSAVEELHLYFAL